MTADSGTTPPDDGGWPTVEVVRGRHEVGARIVRPRRTSGSATVACRNPVVREVHQSNRPLSVMDPPHDLEGFGVIPMHLRPPIPGQVALRLDLEGFEQAGREVGLEDLRLAVERLAADRDVHLRVEGVHVAVGVDHGLPEPEAIHVAAQRIATWSRWAPPLWWARVVSIE